MELFWVVMLVWLVMWFVSNMYRTYEREKTRRDIAAYIAEGSMTPEHGEKTHARGGEPGTAVNSPRCVREDPWAGG